MSQDNATPSPLDALLQQADACYSQDDHVGAIAPLDEALQLTNRHPMIMRAEEDSLDFEVLEVATRTLIEACAALDCDAITKILRNYVSGFEAHEVRHDFVWLKQGRVGKRARQVAKAENVAVLPLNSGQSGPKG